MKILLFWCFPFFFLSFFRLLREKYKKIVLMQKQMILSSERHAEQPFAGQNTQQTLPNKCSKCL